MRLYDVNNTLTLVFGLYKFLGSRNLPSFFLSSGLPKYGNTFNEGQNFANSFYQLCRVVTGTIIINGPQTPLFSYKWASKDIA
jgi:hypothetical protein